jgi:hypothetical protein
MEPCAASCRLRERYEMENGEEGRKNEGTQYRRRALKKR